MPNNRISYRSSPRYANGSQYAVHVQFRAECCQTVPFPRERIYHENVARFTRQPPCSTKPLITGSSANICVHQVGVVSRCAAAAEDKGKITAAIRAKPPVNRDAGGQRLPLEPQRQTALLRLLQHGATAYPAMRRAEQIQSYRNLIK